MIHLVAALSVIAIPPLARHDADCVEATFWALSWMGHEPHDEAVENVRNVSYFFLGRLTVRDEKVDWELSLSRDMKLHPQPSETTSSARLSQCADDMGKHLITPAVKQVLDRLPSDPPPRDQK